MEVRVNSRRTCRQTGCPTGTAIAHQIDETQLSNKNMMIPEI